MEKFSSDYQNELPGQLPEVVRGGRYDGAVIGEDSLKPQEPEIINTILTPEQWRKINELRDFYSKIVSVEAMSRIRAFSEKLINQFGAETLNQIALYHLVLGSAIHDDVDRVDLEDGLIEEFITNGLRETV